MKRLVLCAMAVSFAAAFAAEGSKEPWRDPTVFQINRLPARAIVVPCESADVAIAIAKGERPRTDSAYLQSLDGTWDFRYKHDVGAADWEKSGAIPVPSCWQLAAPGLEDGGYDPPLYTNIRYPVAGFKDGDPMTEPPKDFTSSRFRNPVALYRRTFDVPPSWRGRRVVIHFGGVSSAMYVRLNGHEVGYSEDSRLPAEFDLTPYLFFPTGDGLAPENKLEVEVLKHCDGTFIEDQDFWRLSGIFRSVWLVAESPTAAKDLVVETKLSDDYSSATLTVRDEQGGVVFTKDYERPKLWSCETPNLYHEAFVSGGDAYAVSVGFRRIEIKDAVLTINGKRALFMGTDRHEMEPATGYTVTLDGMRRDIEIFHDLNINAVRTSHYPNDPTWYDLCDREGIYVVCEANIESHGAGYGKDTLAKNPLYHDAHVARGTNMVKTFRNHPSIIFWSMGNEAGDGPNFVDEYKAMRALDATRPIQYEGAQDSDHSDIKCPMYAKARDEEKYVANHPKKPYILCEYAHAMGNSNGDIQDYWDVVRKYPSAQGGFIWDFVDQALWKTDRRGTWLAYGGDFGDRPNDDNFNCNGFITPDRQYHPGAYEIKHAYQPVHVDAWDWDTKTATIYNGYRFLDLSHLNAHWVVTKDGQIVKDGRIELATLGPDSSTTVTIDAPDGDAITFLFVRGRFNLGDNLQVVAHDQFVKPFVAQPVPDEPATRDLVAPMFKLNLYRAPTDNDRGWGMAGVCKVWRDATMTQQLPTGCTSTLDAKRIRDGRILVDWTFTAAPAKPGEQLPPLPRVGLTFSIPKDYTQVEWSGLGPWENYCDRRTSAFFGKWKGVIGLVDGLLAEGADTIAYPVQALNPDCYLEPGEQGYRTGCRSVTFTNPEGKTIKVTALNAPFGFNAWPYTQAALEQAKHQWDLKTDETITVNIDAAMMGVGGDDSWGARPHAEDMLGAGTYKLQFIVEGL